MFGVNTEHAHEVINARNKYERRYWPNLTAIEKIRHNAILFPRPTVQNQLNFKNGRQ